jgi:MFS family permease
MRNSKIRVLLIGANLWYIGEGMLGPLLGLYTERIGGDILDLTWAWAIYLCVTGVCMFAIGGLADRYHATERLMVAGYALNAICTFAYLLISSPWHLLLVQAGLGLASALATPTWDALYSAYAPRQQAGRLWGLAHGQEHLITGGAILAGGYLVYLGSFTLLFLVMGVIQTIAAVYQATILSVPGHRSLGET